MTTIGISPDSLLHSPALRGPRVQLSPRSAKIKGTAIAATALGLFAFAATQLNLDIAQFFIRLGNIGDVLPLFVAFDTGILGEALLQMLTALALSLGALVIGFFISVALAFLCAANTAPSRLVAGTIKGAIAIIRAVPSLVWILMIVASIGFGNTAGLTGLLLSTVGYLVKSFASSIEEQGTHTIEALRATGANWMSIMLKAVLPGVIGSFLAWTAIRFESNISESISLGMVGVGGIGALLMASMRQFNYGAIVAVLLVIVTFMMALELASNALRKKLRAYPEAFVALRVVVGCW
jgi:phosphonate transport system permease protein